MKKIIPLIIVFLLFVSIALAQDCSYNYEDTNLDWSQIPYYCISDIPPEKLDYSKLSQVQRLHMSPEQITLNFDKIEDLSKDVNKLKSIKAIIDKYDVLVVSIEDSFKIRNDQLISSDNILTLTDPFYSQDNLFLLVEEGLAGVTSEASINSKDLPKEDSFYILETDVIFEFDGEEHTVQADFLSTGELFSTPGGFVQYQGVSLRTSDYVEFTFGEEKENAFSFVPMDDKSLSIVHNDPTTTLKFSFGPKSRDLLGPGLAYGLRMTIDQGKVILTNREEEKLAPQIQVYNSKENPKLEIENGKNLITYEDNKLISKIKTHSSSLSSALTVELYDQNENPLIISNNQPQKLIFSRFNEFAIIPSLTQSGFSQVIANEPSVVISERLFLDEQRYTPETFKTEFPDIILSGDTDQRAVFLLTDVLRTLPKEYSESLRLMEFYQDKPYFDFLSKTLEGIEPAAYATPQKTIGISEYGRSSEIIAHELAHILTFKLEDLEVLEKMPSFESTIGGGFRQIEEPPLSFRELWLNVAGDVYGKELKTDWKKPLSLGTTWADGTSGPRNGCVEPYGCNDYYEDVATWVEEIYKTIGKTAYFDYEKFGKLLNPKNPNYKNNMRKLYLLRKYNFITPEQYDSVLKGVDGYLIIEGALEAAGIE